MCEKKLIPRGAPPKGTVINLMLGRGRGGLEQAAVDYAEALSLAAIPALTITTPGAWVNEMLIKAGINPQPLRAGNQWDILAAIQLKQTSTQTKTRAIIATGNRALSIALLTRHLGVRIPIIAVAQNYKTRRFNKADHAFTITHDLKRHLLAQGIAAEKITVMPNVARLSQSPTRPAWHTPPRYRQHGAFCGQKRLRGVYRSTRPPC